MSFAREKIYDVNYQGDYNQYRFPKRQSTKEEKIAKGQRNFIHLTIDYTIVAQLVLPAQEFSYFLLQNLDGVASVYLGFGIVPDVTNKRGILIPSEQAYEPLMVPQNDIWIIGSATGKATLIYSVD